MLQYSISEGPGFTFVIALSHCDTVCSFVPSYPSPRVKAIISHLACSFSSRTTNILPACVRRSTACLHDVTHWKGHSYIIHRGRRRERGGRLLIWQWLVISLWLWYKWREMVWFWTYFQWRVKVFIDGLATLLSVRERSKELLQCLGLKIFKNGVAISRC